MKTKFSFNPIFVLALACTILLSTSCKKDDGDTVLEYSTTIMSPNADDKKVGDAIHIHVNFGEAKEEEIHHINVRIYNADDGTEIYNKPDAAHVHQSGGHYEHHDDITLNVDPDTKWIIESKVWGHEAGLGEVKSSVEFQVLPQ